MKPLIESPNFTQIPNSILDSIADISDAELRVLLFLCRQTFGWHRERVTASASFIAKGIGMSRQGVINGIKRLVESGAVEKKPCSGAFSYAISVSEPVNAVYTPVNAVYTETPEPVNAVYTNKETKQIKRRKKATDFQGTDRARCLVNAFRSNFPTSYCVSKPEVKVKELVAAEQMLASGETEEGLVKVARLNSMATFDAHRSQSATLCRIQEKLSEIKARLNGALSHKGPAVISTVDYSRGA
jgi:phage replication O-like protein O